MVTFGKNSNMKWLDEHPELLQSLVPIGSITEQKKYSFDCEDCPCFSPECVIELDCPSDCPGLPYRQDHQF